MVFMGLGQILSSPSDISFFFTFSNERTRGVGPLVKSITPYFVFLLFCTTVYDDIVYTDPHPNRFRIFKPNRVFVLNQL